MKVGLRGLLICGVLILSACAAPGASVAAEEDAAVELIVWTVPKVLKVGKPGVVQVKLVSETTLGFPVLVLRATNASEASALSLASSYRLLTSLASPVVGTDTTTQQKKHPPALGMVPLEVFEIVANAPGVHDLTVELYHQGGVVRETISVKAVAP